MKKSWIYIFFTAAAFATLEPVSKLVAGQVTPMQLTFLRFLIGGVVLLPFSVRQVRREGMFLKWTDYGRMALLGVLCICVSMVLLQYAVLIADSPALIAILFSSNSVFTVLLAAFFLKEKMTVQRLAAVALCLAGVILCANLNSTSNLLSVLLALGSAFSFSLYTVWSKKYIGKASGIVQTGFSFFSGSHLLLLVLLGKGETFSLISYDLQTWLILLYLGVVVTGMGYWSFFQAMKHASAMEASLVFFLKPVLTPLAAFLINGIVPGVPVYAALILVLTGAYLSSGQLRLPALRKKKERV